MHAERFSVSPSSSIRRTFACSASAMCVVPMRLRISENCLEWSKSHITHLVYSKASSSHIFVMSWVIEIPYNASCMSHSKASISHVFVFRLRHSVKFRNCKAFIIVNISYAGILWQINCSYSHDFWISFYLVISFAHFCSEITCVFFNFIRTRCGRSERVDEKLIFACKMQRMC